MAILLASCGLPSLAQELLRVNGVVVDKDANPMIGVTVRPEGTSTGTVTDLWSLLHSSQAWCQTLLFLFRLSQCCRHSNVEYEGTDAGRQ